MISSEPAMAGNASNQELLEAGVVFIGNLLICIAFFHPEIQGYGDAIRGWNQFNGLLFDGQQIFKDSNQVILRILMAMTTVCIVMGLVFAGLIERATLVTYLALPFSAYLATKIKVEFIFFPFALISTNLGWKKETLVISILLALSYATSENNGYIIIVFRIGVIFFQTFRPRVYMVFLAAGAIVFLDANFKYVTTLFPNFAVYSWTRDIVNPEFSHLETVIVFLSSMVMSIQPQMDFMFGLTYAVFLLFATYGWSVFRPNSYVKAFNQAEVRSGFLTTLLFTSLTHAFQNARYFFFYLPILARTANVRARRLLVLASWPMTFGLVIYYRFVLEM